MRHNRSNCSRRDPRLLKGRHEGRSRDWAERSEKFEHSKQIKQEKEPKHYMEEIRSLTLGLLRACIAGDREKVRSYLIGGADSNGYILGKGLSPIAFAARGGYLEIVKLLLKVKGVELHHSFVRSLNITDIFLYEEWSRLNRERYRRQESKKKESDLEITRDYNSTIQSAIEAGSLDIIRLLIGKVNTNDQLDFTSLLRFTLGGRASPKVNLAIIRCLLDKGADPNILATVGTFTVGKNAFHLACERADGLEAVLLLLERGADPRKTSGNTTGYDFLNPLEIANACGCTDISRVLRIITDMPTPKDRLLIGITMLQELFVYHHLDCSSIIDIWEMMYGGAADPDRRPSFRSLGGYSDGVAIKRIPGRDFNTPSALLFAFKPFDQRVVIAALKRTRVPTFLSEDLVSCCLSSARW